MELKNVLKDIILEFQERGIPNYIPRDIQVPTFKRINKAISIVGPRRSGKTYLMYQIMKERIRDMERILYVNLEDDRLFDMKGKGMGQILDSYKELYPEKTPVVFLDEVQVVPGWEKFVRRLVDSGVEVYISGSSSKLISKELATILRGRALTVNVYPLSFREFLRFNGIELSKNWEHSSQRLKVKKLFDQFMKTSGFPEIVLENDLSLIDDYFKTIFLRDIVERYRIKNLDLMELLMKYLVKNYARDFSINKFHNFAKSLGYKSSTSVVRSYLNMLQESYFAYLVPVWRKGKKEFIYSKKSYVTDHGFLNYLLPEVDPGRLLENIIFEELLKEGKTVRYYKNEKECDFITEDLAIQVTYRLDEWNKQREVDGLLLAEKHTKKKGVIVTYDQEMKTPKTTPAYKFLLR